MAVARKHRIEDPASGETPERARPREMNEADAHADSPNPLADHLLRLEGAFASDDADQGRRYPARVRLAILIGAPAALWAIIALGVIGVRALL